MSLFSELVSFSKKFAISVFAIACVLALVDTPRAFAATPPDSCFNFYNGIIYDYYYTNPACPSDVDIPSQIGGETVTIIGANSFTAHGLTSVTFPSTITSIFSYAFSSNMLTSVVIPDTITFIDHKAFEANKLTSVTIPNGITSIGSDAFSANMLTSVVIPSSVTNIDISAFELQNPLGGGFMQKSIAATRFVGWPHMEQFTMRGSYYRIRQIKIT